MQFKIYCNDKTELSDSSSCWGCGLIFQALLHAESLQRTHQVALALQQRAELLVRYDRAESFFLNPRLFLVLNAASLHRSGHYDPDAVRACAQTVALHWQTLMLRIEDRLKLVNASAAFYRTSQQVDRPPVAKLTEITTLQCKK